MIDPQIWIGFCRLLLLLGLSWVVRLKPPLLEVFGISGRDLPLNIRVRNKHAKHEEVASKMK
ncbi:hypothetical protein ABZ297_03825 [Nonomuraea sp. NPDC005983]|uniref:hypothetical protein n=1 Tax=Nonomuraea sp. NPDC005983 TaxID=3155595 RepID=UPI0033BB5068